jgi:integrase
MRSRHQDGWVEERGKKRKYWYGHYFVYQLEGGIEKRKHKGVNLGFKSELKKWEAEAKLAKVIEAAAGTSTPIKERVDVEWFWENRFLPIRRGNWGEASRRTNESDFRLYILPQLREKPLRDLDRFYCQGIVTALAERGYSEPVVRRVKTMLWSIFDIARDLDFIPKNPMEKVDLPKCKPTPKPVISGADLERLIRAVSDSRDRLILLLGVFGGPRASEVFGITWGCLQGNQLEIRNTAYRGKLNQWRVKRKASFRRIFLPPLLIKAFSAYRAKCSATHADDLVFPSAKTGRPMWPGIWLQDRIQPVARALGITVPVTFQVLRRSCTTRNQKHGSLKDVQTHLGHASISTTGDVYMQELPDSVAQMVELDVADVMGGVQ